MRQTPPEFFTWTRNLHQIFACECIIAYLEFSSSNLVLYSPSFVRLPTPLDQLAQFNPLLLIHDMSTQSQLEGLHWVNEVANSFVYEVTPLIVVKVPRTGSEEREQLSKELEIYKVLSQHAPSPFLVSFFLYTSDGIFLEYMRDTSLFLATSE